MSDRFLLREPGREPIVLHCAAGRWAEPAGGFERLVGEGMWALPGLVDAHAHLAAEEGVSWVSAGLERAIENATGALQSGVMLALDKGWTDLTTIRLMDEVGPERRPDIDAAGVVLAVEDGYWPGFARNVEPGGIVEAVAAAADEARGWVKLIGDWPRRGLGPVANFDEVELRAAVSAAVARGARLAIHTMARDVPSLAVRAGVHSIEHGLFLTEDDLGELGARGGMWVPTVLQMEAVRAQLGYDSSGGRLLGEGLDNVSRLLPLAREAGVRVLTGTDLAVGSRQVASEAVRLWEMGLSAPDVIASVSRSGLIANDRPGGFEAGAPANAVLFDDDPLGDPRVLAHPALVVRHGEVVT